MSDPCLSVGSVFVFFEHRWEWSSQITKVSAFFPSFLHYFRNLFISRARRPDLLRFVDKLFARVISYLSPISTNSKLLIPN